MMSLGFFLLYIQHSDQKFCMVPEPHDSDLPIAAATVNTGICSCLAGVEGGGNQSALVFKAIDGEERMKTEWRRQFKA